MNVFQNVFRCTVEARVFYISSKIEFIHHTFSYGNDITSMKKLLFYWTNLTSGQSYKHFMLVNYDSRVVIWGIFKSATTLES